MQRPAKPSTPVRSRPPPPVFQKSAVCAFFTCAPVKLGALCPSGEIGRHSGLKIRRLPERGRTGSIPVSGTIPPYHVVPFSIKNPHGIRLCGFFVVSFHIGKYHYIPSDRWYVYWYFWNSGTPYTNTGANMALTDTFVRQVKHSGSTAGDKHADGQGLYLLVTGSGKYWRM